MAKNKVGCQKSILFLVRFSKFQFGKVETLMVFPHADVEMLFNFRNLDLGTSKTIVVKIDQ